MKHWLTYAVLLLTTTLSCVASPRVETMRRPVSGAATSAAHASVPIGDWSEKASHLLEILSDREAEAGPLTIALTVVRLWPMSDASTRAEVTRGLGEVRDTLVPDLRRAVDAFRFGQADGACAANRAARAIGLALRGVALTLARTLRWDIDPPMAFALSLAGQITDELQPSCAATAGWSQFSRDTQAALAGRGRGLRRFPSLDEARRANAEGGMSR